MRLVDLYRGREVIVALNRGGNNELLGKIEAADDSGVTLLCKFDEDEEGVTVIIPMSSILFIELV